MNRTPFALFRQSLGLLATRRFGTFWFATFLSNIGTWVQQVAQPWLLLTLGASPFLVGVDAFAMDAPVLLLTLLGGVLADHGDRRRVITLFQSIQMLCPTLLVFLLLHDGVSGRVTPPLVIALSAIVGVTDALSMPSFQSIVPSIVLREQIGAGLALNSTQFNLSRIVGPAIAGVLMATTGAIGCFAVSAASYLPFILVALWILPRGRRAPEPGEATARAHPFDGIRAVTRDPRLRGALVTVFLTSLLCGPLVTFSPVLVKNVFHVAASGFSVSIGAFGVGGLLGAMGLLAIDPQRDRRRLSSAFAAGYGAIVVAAALAPWFWILPALLLLAGASMTVSNTSSNSILQTMAAPRLRGQAVSLYMLAMRGGASLGSVLTGLSTSALGVRHALVINGVIALAAHTFVGRRWCRTPLAE